MPVYAAIFLVMTMSSIGLPTLNGFIGEFLILQGVFVASKIWAAFAGERRRARRGLHAVSLSAHDVRQDREPEERAAARPEPPRVRDVRAAADPGGLDGPLSGAVPATGSRRRCSTSSRGSARSTRPKYAECNTAPTPEAIAASNNPAAQFLSALPCDVNGNPLPVDRRPDRTGADAAGHFAHAISTTSCRSWCSRAGALLVLIADVLLPRGSQRAGLGHAAGARRDRWPRCVPFRQHPRRGRARPARGRSVRAVLQGHLPRRRGDHRADVDALSRDRRRAARASTTS